MNNKFLIRIVSKTNELFPLFDLLYKFNFIRCDDIVSTKRNLRDNIKRNNYDEVYLILSKKNSLVWNFRINLYSNSPLQEYGLVVYLIEEFIEKFRDLLEWSNGNKEILLELENLILQNYDSN